MQLEKEVTSQVVSGSEVYKQKLQRYEQEFTRTIQVEFPLSQPVCEELSKFQSELGLTNEDVAQIREPIIERRTAEFQQRQEQQRQQDVEEQKQQEAERLRIGRQLDQDYKQNQPPPPNPPQSEPVRSSSSNKLLLAGACLSAIVISGGLFYFNSPHPQPRPVIEKELLTGSPTPVTSPSSSPSLPSTPTAVAPSSFPTVVSPISPGARDQAAGDQAAREQAAREQAAKAAREQAAREQAARDQQALVACSSTYNPELYRPGSPQWDGHIGKIAFNNGTDRTVKVTLYHPDNPSTPFGSWNIQPGDNTLLGDDNYAMDWGIQVDDSNICIVKLVSDFHDDSNGAHFQTWPERLR